MNDHFKTKADAAGESVKPAELKNVRVGIIGLGYVGLPLAVYMARHFPVVGFDVNKARVARARRAAATAPREVTDEEFARRTNHLLHRRSRGAARLQFLHRHRADADRRGQAPRPQALDRARARRSAACSRPAMWWSTNRRSIPAPRKRSACRSWRRSRASPSTATSSSATRRSASIPATSSTGCPTSSRSPRARRPKPPTSSTRSMAAS